MSLMAEPVSELISTGARLKSSLVQRAFALCTMYPWPVKSPLGSLFFFLIILKCTISLIMVDTVQSLKYSKTLFFSQTF